MATPVLNPFIMRDCLFQVAADNYEAHVSAVEFVPSSSVVRFKGLTPSSNHAFNTTADWLANLSYAQDWNTPDSLSEYLHEHEGESIDVTFQPVNGGRPITATILVTPGMIGGPVDAVAVASVSCGSTKPVLGSLTPAVPTVTAVSPTSIATAGGDLVRITGTGFTGATDVDFAAAAATEFFVDSDSSIFAVAPANSAGARTVTVTNATGVSTVTVDITYA